jgi:hypothetical protein
MKAKSLNKQTNLLKVKGSKNESKTPPKKKKKEMGGKKMHQAFFYTPLSICLNLNICMSTVVLKKQKK